jgi:hypothetical protein
MRHRGHGYLQNLSIMTSPLNLNGLHGQITDHEVKRNVSCTPKHGCLEGVPMNSLDESDNVFKAVIPPHSSGSVPAAPQ